MSKIFSLDSSDFHSFFCEIRNNTLVFVKKKKIEGKLRDNSIEAYEQACTGEGRHLACPISYLQIDYGAGKMPRPPRAPSL